MTLLEFSKNISKLKQEKKYSEALACFKGQKALFSQEEIQSSPYILSDVITCLRCTQQLDSGFLFVKMYNITIDSAQNARIIMAYGWLLWAKFKVENKEANLLEEVNRVSDYHDDSLVVSSSFAKNELAEKIKELLALLVHIDSEFAYTLISSLFTLVVKTEKKKNIPNWKFINEFCDLIDRHSLSKQCSTIQIEKNGRLKDMELASDFESWYAYKTKSLIKLGKWEECFALAKEAIESIDVFHYSNDIWFARRVALSKKNLGDAESAIQELMKILKKKREWFIQKELAELFFEKMDVTTCFKMAISAMNNFGPLAYKVDVIVLLGKTLKQQEERELSIKHFELAEQIRKENGWKVPEKLQEEIQQFSASERTRLGLLPLRRELQKYWKSFDSRIDSGAKHRKPRP